MITLTLHERQEWLRFSKALRERGFETEAVAYIRAAFSSGNFTATEYDAFQAGYRAWLVFDEYPHDRTDTASTK